MTQFSLMPIPLLGSVGASRSHERFDMTGWRNISPIRNAAPSDKFIATPVEGDSLTGDRIFDGDFVIIRLTFDLDEITPGKLVSVNTPSGTLIKHIYRRPDGQIRLVSSNDAYAPIVYDEELVTICGIVVRAEQDFS
jgi:SOS-response transcriptional repressor LexA